MQKGLGLLYLGAVGNSDYDESIGGWSGQVWEGTLGWAAGAYAETDPHYAMELMASWEAACAPATIEPSPPNQLAPLLFLDLSLPRLPPVQRQSERLTSYVVLRKPTSNNEFKFMDGPKDRAG